LQLFTFSGTRINRTLQLLLNVAEIKNVLDDSCSQFEFEVPKHELFAKFQLLHRAIDDIDKHVEDLLESSPALLDFSKWGQYLPLKFQIKLIKDRYFDIQQTEQFLHSLRLVES